MARLKEKYTAEVAPALMKKFNYKSPMQIPKIDKVVINCGCGEARDNSKVIDAVAGDLKGHNQVYLRAEAYIGWGIMDGKAFAKVTE